MSVFAQGYGISGSIAIISPIMAPGHSMRMDSAIVGDGDGTLSVNLYWYIDNQKFLFDKRIWIPEQLANHYEVFHHQLHGFDPRGADPREADPREGEDHPPDCLCDQHDVAELMRRTNPVTRLPA